MNFEWDERKRLSDIEKHGIDFVSAVRSSTGGQAAIWRPHVAASTEC